MCGKSAGKGYHLTTHILDSGDDDLIPDEATLSPRETLMGLEFHQMPELSREFGVLDGLSSSANFHLLDFMHWFVNDCCRAKFRRECSNLGFKIDREELDEKTKQLLAEMVFKRARLGSAGKRGKDEE